jgi:hypothetical protein
MIEMVIKMRVIDVLLDIQLMLLLMIIRDCLLVVQCFDVAGCR